MSQPGSNTVAPRGTPPPLRKLAACLDGQRSPEDLSSPPAKLSGSPANLSSPREPNEPGRWAAVCVLFSATNDPDILFTQRADTLRNHPLQISFPGGREDTGDDGPCATALRETEEEIGLQVRQTHVLGRLASAEAVVSRFEVVPVVAWWDGTEALHPNTAEVKQVLRWKVSELASPENRITALHPSGFTGPAWTFGDLFLWGFTARIADQLLRLGGWELPWDKSRRVDVPNEFMQDHLTTRRATLKQDPH